MRVAKTTCMVGGSRGVLQRGTIYEDDDPLVVQYPHLFESAEDQAARLARPRNTAEMNKFGTAVGASINRREPDAGRTEIARNAPGDVRVPVSPGPDGGGDQHPCPVDSCGRTFPTEQGATVHLSRTNDDAHAAYKAQQVGAQ